MTVYFNLYKNCIIIIFFSFSVLDIIYLVFCTTHDIKERALIHELNRQMKAYETALSGIIRISQNNAANLNNCIHDYQKNKSINKIFNEVK